MKREPILVNTPGAQWLRCAPSGTVRGDFTGGPTQIARVNGLDSVGLDPLLPKRTEMQL